MRLDSAKQIDYSIFGSSITNPSINSLCSVTNSVLERVMTAIRLSGLFDNVPAIIDAMTISKELYAERFLLTDKITKLSRYTRTHSLTYLLTHLLTQSLIYSLTYLLTHSSTHSPTYSLTQLTYSEVISLSNSLYEVERTNSNLQKSLDPSTEKPLVVEDSAAAESAPAVVTGNDTDIAPKVYDEGILTHSTHSSTYLLIYSLI